MEKKYFSNEVKIALVAVLGIVILFFGMQFLKGMNLFSTSNAYLMKFDNINGLSASTPIYANGYKVGYTASPTTTPNRATSPSWPTSRRI